MAIRQTKRRQAILALAGRLPGRPVKDLARLTGCAKDTIWRLVKAGELVSIKRKIFVKGATLTVEQVKAMFMPRKFPPKPCCTACKTGTGDCDVNPIRSENPANDYFGNDSYSPS